MKNLQDLEEGLTFLPENTLFNLLNCTELIIVFQLAPAIFCIPADHSLSCSTENPGSTTKSRIFTPLLSQLLVRSDKVVLGSDCDTLHIANKEFCMYTLRCYCI